MATHGCKVCRVLDERGVDHYDDRLLEEWQADRSQRKGYRALARWLNVTLLRREMDQAGLPTLGGEAASKYERLRDDDRDSAEVERMLRREGVGIDALDDDFVSYGVMRTHLLECLDAEYEPAESASDWEAESIRIARDHAGEKITDAVRSLVNKDEIAVGGDVSVRIDAEIECGECEVRAPLRRVRRRGYVCECSK
jgi:hypothetical protein